MVKSSAWTDNSLEKLYQWISNRIEFNVEALESVLKKCPNINNVIIGKDVSPEVLSPIVQYCPNIKSLTLAGNTDDMLEFKMDDKELKEFKMSKLNELKNVLRFFPNLREVEIPMLAVLFDEDKEFLPKLKYFGNSRGIGFEIKSKDVNKLFILSDKYSKTMKKIIFWFDDLTAEELKTCTEYIARFENLKELKLVFNRNKTTKPIDDCLSLIGQKCNKLLKFDLYITSCLLMSDQFFDIMSEFKSIKKLNICFSQLNEVKGSVECFKHCTELNHLDIDCEGLKEDFFANIVSFVPKLQSLRISTHKRFSDTFINSF